ncbi:3-oxoacyl-ACP reductase FabG [Actinosynnema pretiosum subsp. pretiosum]|uniref:3-oxoacyl-ACP reductase FabG n=1 Tax=Actinosynnema pretiosum subsp. pretiosum TaxID=103721 RepID=A0AA45L5P6_9PSEU|nr:3-oxoacyl-ACP reductase FabG [Actinosynnema pretiosum subsp. pretiosum]
MTGVALVTGGNRGIGLATATALAKAGMRVAVTHRGGGAPAELFGVRCDVRDAEQVDRAFTEVERELGPVGVLVANAGVTRDRLVATMGPEDFEDVLRTNLTGAYLVARRAVRGMVRHRGGRIVLVASVSALIGARGQANYTAAKAGMIGFARSAALELASRGITVNVVAPGWISTDMTDELPEAARVEAAAHVPMRRFGAPEEAAAAIAFLASDAASYVTGVVLPVDGGLSLER